MEMNSENLLYNEIGRKIKLRRKEIGLTQENLANITNYSHSFIANIESNTYQAFSISALNNIAKALNTTMKNLLPDEKEIVSHFNLKCEYCNYFILIPPEISKLLRIITELAHNKLSFTCPKCHKKIMF